MTENIIYRRIFYEAGNKSVPLSFYTCVRVCICKRFFLQAFFIDVPRNGFTSFVDLSETTIKVSENVGGNSMSVFVVEPK